jgi:hypothetical protein
MLILNQTSPVIATEKAVFTSAAKLVEFLLVNWLSSLSQKFSYTF